MNPAALILSMASLGAADPSLHETPAPIEQSLVIPAPVDAVWARWTTESGLVQFFARAVNLRLEVGGEFEMFFFPDNPPGLRGAEGTRIMALEPPRRLAFDWDAAPPWPEQRSQRTMVEVRLVAVPEGTRVTLRHVGWGDGPEWQAVRDYFDPAWLKILKRLRYSFVTGPIDWDDPPQELMHSG